MKALLTLGILTFTSPAFSQVDDLAVEKENMNAYFDQKAERVQTAKDCVMNAKTSKEVKKCKVLLEQDFDDHIKRLKENQNGQLEIIFRHTEGLSSPTISELNRNIFS